MLIYFKVQINRSFDSWICIDTFKYTNHDKCQVDKISIFHKYMCTTFIFQRHFDLGCSCITVIFSSMGTFSKFKLGRQREYASYKIMSKLETQRRKSKGMIGIKFQCRHAHSLSSNVVHKYTWKHTFGILFLENKSTLSSSSYTRF